MEIIYQNESSDSPTIHADLDKRIIEVRGASLTSPVGNCYDVLIEWMHDHSSNLKKGFTLNVALDYFNTYSAKKILDLFLIAEAYSDAGNVEVNWIYCDIEMKEAGDDYDSIIDLPFNKIPALQ